MNSALIFFYLFLIIVQYILLNLFIAVVCQGFSEAQQEADAIIVQKDIDLFNKCRGLVDPMATGYITLEEFKIIINELEKEESKLALEKGFNKLKFNYI